MLFLFSPENDLEAAKSMIKQVITTLFGAVPVKHLGRKDPFWKLCRSSLLVVYTSMSCSFSVLRTMSGSRSILVALIKTGCIKI